MFKDDCCHLISFKLKKHVVESKALLHLASKAEQGQEGLPVPYRFQVSPAANGKCNVFKPNVISSDSGAVRLFWGCSLARELNAFFLCLHLAAVPL